MCLACAGCGCRYLEEASHTPQSMHVVYINTSLYTKAAANARVPTITCTSSNVVQTVLQGFAQVGVGVKPCTIPGCSRSRHTRCGACCTC